MKSLILVIAIFASSAIAQSAQSPLIAYCALEKGCTFCTSEYTYSEIDGILDYLGTYEKDRGIMTFFVSKNGEQTHYPDRKRTPAELNAYFGGKGAVTTSNRCPSLRREGSIQPNDGIWSIETNVPKAVDCPAGTADQIKKLKMFESGQKSFSKPFTPDDLLNANEVRWLSTGLNRYRGVFSGPIGGFDTVYEVSVLSPDSMKGNLSFEIKIPGQKVCKVSMDFDYVRAG